MVRLRGERGDRKCWKIESRKLFENIQIISLARKGGREVIHFVLLLMRNIVPEI